MKKCFFFFIVLAFFIPTCLIAQTRELKGKVIDTHTKEPVGFASVYLNTSKRGTTTDSAGFFYLRIDPQSGDSLLVSYVGYANYKMPVSIYTEDQTYLIELDRGGPGTEVLVKTKVNKGLFLWRKIMSKKKYYNRYKLNNFAYESYNKLEVDLKNFKEHGLLNTLVFKQFSFVLDNIDSTSEKDPFLPAYLVETISDYAYQSDPKKFRETIKASQTKGFKNESVSKLLGVMNQNVNIYSNYINVMERDFISPFHDNADDYYRFNVPDTQIIHGQKVFHFTFTPKRAGQSTFSGDAWVISKTFQIQKITLYIGKEANINFIDRLSIFQEFHAENDSIYFLTRDKFFADFRTLGKGSLTLIGRKTTSYKDIVINSDSITSMFKDQRIEELILAKENITNATDSAWSSMRHDSLSTNEKAIYQTIDKLLAMPKYQRFERNLRFLALGYKDIGNIEIGPWFNWYSVNQWEANRFRFDVGTNPGFHKKLYLHGYLAYGTKDQKFKGKAEAYWVVKRDPLRFTLHAAYLNDIDIGISQFGEVSQDNIFTVAIRKPNASRKFLQVHNWVFDAFKDWGKGISTELFVARRQFNPLLNLPTKSSFPVTTGESMTSFEIALKLRFAYLERFFEGDYHRYSLGTKYPIVELLFVKGVSGVLKSAYDYSRVSLMIKDKMKLSPLGSLSYKVYAGKVFGTLPFTLLEIHPGNDIYYYSNSNYNLMTRFEYLSDQYAGINVEHNIGSGLFRFIPLTRKLKWRQFWNIKTVWGSATAANRALNTSTFKYLNGRNYTELGTGIDNIFRVFRLDFIWRIDPQRTLPYYSRFGIFGSFQFQF